MVLFSGTSNLPLASKVAKKLGVNLGEVELNRFSDGECRVWVKERIEDKDVFVLQSLSTIADQNLLELCLLGDALKRLGAKSLTAIIPWLGYSKQDKEFRKGEAVSSQLVAKFIETAGFQKVITLELHSSKIKEYFKIPVVELSAKTELVKVVKTNYLLTGGNTTVISPDKGGAGRSEQFANLIGLPIAYVEKERDLTTGKVTILSIDKAINGKTVFIYDDIINTGSTAVELAKFLHKKGAKKIIFIGIHGVLSGQASSNIQKSFIDEVLVTDTIQIPKEKLFKKLKIIPIADLIFQSLKP